MSAEGVERASVDQHEHADASPPPGLSVATLGGFALARNGTPVGRREWQSRKARDLLKLLITRRGRPAPRDWLMEALWPEQDRGLLSNRLSVALSTLRAVLDPEHRFAADYFLTATAATVTLRSDRVKVDVERFLADGQSALELLRDGDLNAARPRLEAAEAAYRGDFLEEDLYEDWTTALREEARSLYISMVGGLAEIAHAAGRHDAAIRYRLRALESDRWDEGAHLGLIGALVTAGRHGDARRAHRDYAARMRDIGVEPTPFAAVSAGRGVRLRSTPA
jgi:DNA-binding SARP family transcriptional activator